MRNTKIKSVNIMLWF